MAEAEEQPKLCDEEQTKLCDECEAHAAAIRERGETANGEGLIVQSANNLLDQLNHMYQGTPAKTDDGVKEFIMHYATHKGHTSCVKAIIHTGECDLDQQSIISRCTALMIAAQKGRRDILTSLIDAGADINTMDKRDKDAVMYASENGNHDCLKILLKHNPKLDRIQKHNKQSALMMATWAGHLSCMELLLDAGAKFGLFEQKHYTVWDLFGFALVRLSSPVLEELFGIINSHEGALSMSIFQGIVRKNCRRLLQSVLSNGYVIKGNRGQENPSFKTAWMNAIEDGYPVNIQLLLHYKDRLHISVNDWRDQDRKTVLQIACEQPEDGVVQALLRNGADPNFSKKERSALFITLRSLGYNQNGLHNMASLIKYGCNVDKKCKVHLRGLAQSVELTPLELAIFGKNLRAARMLIEAGAQNYSSVHHMYHPHKRVISKHLEASPNEIQQFIQREIQSPVSLFSCCTQVLRSALGPNINELIEELPLANHIKTSVCYTEIDQISSRFRSDMEKLKNRGQLDEDMTEASISSDDGDFLHSDSDISVSDEEGGILFDSDDGGLFHIFGEADADDDDDDSDDEDFQVIGIA